VTDAKRSRNKWTRVGVLSGVLAVACLQYVRVRRAEQWVPDWEHRESAAVMLLVPPDLTQEERRLSSCTP